MSIVVEGGRSRDEACSTYKKLVDETVLIVPLGGLTGEGWSGESGDVWLPGHLSTEDALTACLAVELTELGIYEVATTRLHEWPTEDDIHHSWWITEPDEERLRRANEGDPGAEPYTRVSRDL